MDSSPLTEALALWFVMSFGMATIIDLLSPILSRIRGKQKDWR
jgi:hypothetical protein